MGLDLEPGCAADISGDGGHPAGFDLGRSGALRADHVMVVHRLALDVGMVAVGQVDPLDRVQLGEQLERPEDRGPAHVQPALAGIVDKVGSREVAVSAGDQAGHHAARLGQPVARPVKHADDR